MQQPCEKYLKHLTIPVIDEYRAFGAGLRNLMSPWVASVGVYQDCRVALESFILAAPDVIVTLARRRRSATHRDVSNRKLT